MECERVRGENQGCQHHAPHPPHAAAPAVPFPENGRGACVRSMAQGEDVGRWKRQSHQENGDAKAFFLSVSPYFFSLPSEARGVGGAWRRAPANERRGEP